MKGVIYTNLCIFYKETSDIMQVSSRLKSESPVVLNTARTKAYAKNARGLRTATTSGYDTPSTLSHVGEHSPFPVGTLVRILILRVSEYIFAVLSRRLDSNLSSGYPVQILYYTKE